MTGQGSKTSLRLWLRLLKLNRRVESRLREFLRVDHGMTLSRFDVLAGLRRQNAPMTMTELGRLLLVSNGNVTTVVIRLETDGLVTRTASADDRRNVQVALTAAGRAGFDRMAAAHEAEIDAVFSILDPGEREALGRILVKLNAALAHQSGRRPRGDNEAPAPEADFLPPETNE